MRQLIELYRRYSGVEPSSIQEFPSSGSNRKYLRLTSADGVSLIGTIGNNLHENEAFFAIAASLRKAGIEVPEVLCISGDRMRYLQTDFGDLSLYSMLDREDLLERTMERLPEIQFKGAEGLDFSVCHPDSEFNARMVDFDLNYFKYCYLKAVTPEFDEIRLQDDFDRLKSELLKPFGNTFMYRDFQSRNVMIKDGRPCFIDFQGGRRGPVYYDLASFVWQARAHYPEALKRKLVDAYYASYSRFVTTPRGEFEENLKSFAYFRLLQSLGACGYRGYFERKPLFLENAPYALRSLKELGEAGMREKCPYINTLVLELAGRIKPVEERNTDGKLEVRVSSFSYRKGIPVDPSGNGGGYVFDCRAVHNPGRYDRYKALTGLDSEVIEFLENDGEILAFLENIYPIVDAHVERFIERGFTSLRVNFGCTGGHHRSVYSAEHLAEHLAGKFDVRVIVNHTELGISRTL